MGAEVIKLEKLGTGDLIRQWDSAVQGLSSGMLWLNANKRSFAMDVKKKAGLESSCVLPIEWTSSWKICSGRRRSHGSRRGGTDGANPRLIYVPSRATGRMARIGTSRPTTC